MSAPATTGDITVDIAKGVGWVTMKNPSKRNALSTNMLALLDEALRRLDKESAVKVIVLRGEGTDAFAAGADISEFEGQQRSADAREASDSTVTRLFAGIEALSTPLVAMIYGYCLGAGVAVALGADIRIAARGARFAIPATRLGIGYPVSLTHALVHTVGQAHAADLLFTGRAISSEEALKFGLVNRVVPVADLVDEVHRVASDIAANAPISVNAAKVAIRSFASPELRQEAEALVLACADSMDAVEGQQAFMQKRRARFVGA